ncbi:acetyl-CoA acetyltransferase [Microbacterium sp. LWH7-1.2]|uniref:acetyl-CoA acetyltransferase n=1 Tax=Microbacterium sp. LWH7-1.2 TaxID=3135257 RepID=UPI0031391F7F
MTDGRRAVIVGVADAPLTDGRVAPEQTVLQILATTGAAALATAGLSWQDVDGLATTGAWGLSGVGQWPTLTLAEYLRLAPTWMDSTALGGSSFEVHVAHAAAAIERGDCETVVITYASTQRSQRSRSLGGRPPELSAQYETIWGLLSPAGSYALAAQRHMHEFGTTSEHLAAVAVAAHQWAALTPGATTGAITMDEAMSSPLLSDPLRKVDCCLVTDGGGAIVLTTAERARDLDATPIAVSGTGSVMTHQFISQMPDLARSTAGVSAGRALAAAGLSIDDMDVVEVYDSFTISVLLALEALGVCAPGEAGPLALSGGLGPGGDRPVNTNGGGLAHSHPGMYGIFLLIEAYRQLTGQAGVRQLPRAETAIVNGTGGVLSSNGTVVLTRA